eukprot:jgi/Tetstr1/456004/TSEL_042782.t1
MLTGFKGVKYGLQKPAKASAATAKKKGAPLAAFAQGGSDSEDEDDINVQLRRQQAHKAKQAKWEQQHKEAMEQDASVFDYDGVYDSIQQARVQPKQAEKAARKSRYIENLLDKAKERKKEQDILYERQLERERKVEDELFGDKDKFVTAAYKKKLEEDKQWLEQEKRKEELEARNDVTKREGLGDFYRNLHRNAAFGGSRYAQVHASEEQRKEETTIKQGPRDTEAANEASPDAGRPARSPAPQQEAAEGSRRGRAPSPADMEPPRREAADSSHGRQARDGSVEQPRPSAPHAAEQLDADAGAKVEQPAEAEAAASSGAIAPQAGKRRNKEDAVAAARARYLARKKARA